MRPGTPRRRRFRLPARARRWAGAAAVAGALAAPAGAGASATAVEVVAGELRVTGLPGTPSAVEVRYEAGFGGAGDRLLLVDPGGVVPSGAECAALDASTASCDAGGVNSIGARLGDGDDVLVLDAGSAEEVPAALRARLRGESGADVIRGGAGDDEIEGGRGRDVVAGWSGDDLLLGGVGSDGLLGYAGDDRLEGGRGRDALFGHKGRDLMLGGPQNDVLLARDGFRERLIDCGPGKRQRAVTDGRDPRPRGCLAAPGKGR